MKTYVLGFHEIDKGDLPLVGGKGLNLGELSKIEGVRVPAGFCVTTDAYQSMVGQNEKMSEPLDRLCQVKLKDKEQIAKLSQEIRDEIENVKIDREIEEAIRLCHSNLGENEAYLRLRICRMLLLRDSRTAI